VTRREVLDLSAKLFAVHGYRSTSLEVVAEQLGVTRQALYYHFKSKSEILGALYEEQMTKLESAVAAVAADPAVPAQDRFVRMLEAHVAVTVANADLVVVLLHERPEIAKLKELRSVKRRRDYARSFTEAYAAGVAAGVLLPMDPWMAVNTLISATNGVSWWHHVEGGSGARAAEVGERLTTLLAGGFLMPATAERRTRRAPRSHAA